MADPKITIRVEGSGLPQGGAPNQQLVTDANGVAKWEDRMAYKQTSESIFAVEQKVNTTKAPYGSSISGSGVCNGDIVYSKTYRVTFNGVDYNCVAHVGRDSMNFLGDSALSAANVSDGSDEFSNGEPFAVRTNAGVFYLSTESAGEYTVTISEIEEEVKRLDSDLLPEIVPAVDQPHMQLVTDANGEKKWEDRLAYSIGNAFAVWNGDRTGLTRVLQTNMGVNGLWGPFDYDGGIDDLIGATVEMSNGKTYVITEDCVNADRTGLLLHSYDSASEPELAFTTADNVSVPRNKEYESGSTYTIKTAGLWLYSNSTWFVTSVKKETIKPIDPKYLPDGVSGGGLPVYELLPYSLDEVPEEYRTPYMFSSATYAELEKLFADFMNGRIKMVFDGSPVLNGYVYTEEEEEGGRSICHVEFVGNKLIASAEGIAVDGVFTFSNFEISSRVDYFNCGKIQMQVGNEPSYQIIRAVRNSGGHVMFTIGRGIRMYSSSGKAFDITVDDSGTITATEVT